MGGSWPGCSPRRPHRWASTSGCSRHPATRARPRSCPTCRSVRRTTPTRCARSPRPSTSSPSTTRTSTTRRSPRSRPRASRCARASARCGCRTRRTSARCSSNGGLPVPPFEVVDPTASPGPALERTRRFAEQHADAEGRIVAKASRGGYDGRGVWMLARGRARAVPRRVPRRPAGARAEAAARPGGRRARRTTPLGPDRHLAGARDRPGRRHVRRGVPAVPIDAGAGSIRPHARSPRRSPR